MTDPVKRGIVLALVSVLTFGATGTAAQTAEPISVLLRADRRGRRRGTDRRAGAGERLLLPAAQARYLVLLHQAEGEDWRRRRPHLRLSETATQRLDKVTAELRELKARAILDPTTENITAYVEYQREQLDRASMFSDVWQRAVWQNPDLDYTLQRPVGTVAKAAWLNDRKVDRDQALNRLGERYGIFYFFAQSCGACSIFSPILKSVTDSHGLHVMAISTDGGPSDVFTHYSVDSGQRERMGLTSKATPAVVLFDTVTKRAVPIGLRRDRRRRADGPHLHPDPDEARQ